MPRGDRTGPWGIRSMGYGRGGLGMGFGARFGRCLQNGFGPWYGFTDNAITTPETLEAQALRLEEQAAKLRNLAEQNRKAE